jgi:hypothetical protein
MSVETPIAVALAALLALAPAVALAADDDETPLARMIMDKSVCTDCHTRVVKPGEHAPDYFLSYEPSATCLGCHQEHEHVGVLEHADEDARTPWPGDENGKIACFTCHDPHPEGVIEGRRVYRADVGARTGMHGAARPQRGDAARTEEESRFGALLRFSTAAGEGCLSCHDVRTDGKTWRQRALSDKFRSVLPH